MASVVGHVTVDLYAAIGEGKHHHVGKVQLPLTYKRATDGTLEVNLAEAVDYTRASLEAVFSGEDEEEEKE